MGERDNAGCEIVAGVCFCSIETGAGVAITVPPVFFSSSRIVDNVTSRDFFSGSTCVGIG
jgi:hypothetical protein